MTLTAKTGAALIEGGAYPATKGGGNVAEKQDKQKEPSRAQRPDMRKAFGRWCKKGEEDSIGAEQRAKFEARELGAGRDPKTYPKAAGAAKGPGK